jgi:hypothetical protein
LKDCRGESGKNFCRKLQNKKRKERKQIFSDDPDRWSEKRIKPKSPSGIRSISDRILRLKDLQSRSYQNKPHGKIDASLVIV